MILEVEGVSFRYNSAPVLEGVSFQVHTHQLTAILGPNGAGKTTLLRCMARILKPAAGTVRIDGQELGRASAREVARQVAYVAQSGEPGRVTAFDAVLLGRKPHIGWNASHHDLELVQAALHRLGLEQLALRHVDQMSGGEYQKVRIARALVQEPTVMLLDEPTSSLDLKNQLSILRLLRKIVRGHRMCAVMSMHDLNTAFRYADNFLFLKDGAIRAAVDGRGITASIVQEVYGVPVSIRWHQDHPVVLPMDGD
ncbi:MAG: ABC transporter ATP-binding protein [Spirochaetales bacterium]|nr:ABC transporter ATP-binding protein [Spirochaetales bacterium]